MNSHMTTEDKSTHASDIVQNEAGAPMDKFSSNISECFDQEKYPNSDDKTRGNDDNAAEETFSIHPKFLKARKKDDCSVQYVLRALNSLTTSEEKLAAMCKKYADLFDENRKLQSTLKQYQKQITTVIKEKEQVRTDLAKSVLSRSRLESLCRELQRQNREVKEESFQKIREEEEKRKAVSAKFQITLNEITELMKQDNDKTMKLRDDNIDMTSKLKSFYEQYEIREQHIEKMAKQMALESELYEAKIAKMEMETAAEKEVLLQEKQQLLMTISEYQTRFQEYQNIEMTLRNQVALYNSKYEEFEKSLTRSNKMFGSFKDEMQIMSNKIVKLECETAAWKLRWEKTQKALIEMATEKQKADQEIVIASKQIATLHKLCRTLQTERTQLLSTIKQNNISSSCSAVSKDCIPENTDAKKTESTYSLKTTDEKKNLKKPKNCNNLKEKLIKNTKKAETVSKNNVTDISNVPQNQSKYNEVTTSINTMDSTNEENSVNTNANANAKHNTASLKQESDENDLIANILNISLNASVDVNNQNLSNDSFIEEAKKETAEKTIDNSYIQEKEISSKNSFQQNLADSDYTMRFSFPQTNTFSFTYNGNVLNELKHDPKIVSKDGNGDLNLDTFPESFISTPLGDTSNCSPSKAVVNSEDFPIHNSRKKIFPKKKKKKSS